MKNRLAKIRQEKGFTQLKVSMDLHLNQNSISRYESGTRDMGCEMLVLFADYYDVSIDYILYRTEVPDCNKTRG